MLQDQQLELPYTGPRKVEHFRPCVDTHPSFGVQCRREHGHLHHHSYKDARQGIQVDWPVEDGE